MKNHISKFLALALLTVAVPALAAGGGGSGSNDVPKPTTSPKQLHCKPGEVVKTVHHTGKPDTKECVKVTGSNLSDPELYQQGWLLAKSGEYDWAITVLSAVSNQNDPDVLNMLGYSNRKAGRLELGISYYAKALEQRPNFVRAREYLGEGLVAAGRVDEAKLQLQEISKICGTECEEFEDLQKAIIGDTTEGL
ncbi:MAG: tetratricopeptide repeat protein [Aestuariivirga sp.]